MSYLVDWTDDALEPLAEIWLVGADREAINQAQNKIDQQLSHDPFQGTRHLAEGLFAIDVFPLRAQFEVDEEKKIVTVVGVGRLSSEEI